MGGVRVSRKGSGSFFFLESLPVCLITLLRSLISYIPLSGFLWSSDSTCQVVRYEVKGQPELKDSPEEVENQAEKKHKSWLGAGELGKGEQGRNSLANLATAVPSLQGGQK